MAILAWFFTAYPASLPNGFQGLDVGPYPTLWRCLEGSLDFERETRGRYIAGLCWSRR